jgi:DNA-binding transcriptional LysR family regulator
MELRQLEYFVAVAEEANFTRAAARVHVAQPGVSAQIRRLERELGQPLLDRSGRTVRLTEVGAAVLPYARTALGAVAGARRAVDELTGLVRGRVAVGMLTACSSVDLPELLADFHHAHPAVEITLAEDNSDRLLAGVLAGRLDLALVGLATKPPLGIETEVVADEPLVAAVHHEDPLAARTSITLEALLRQPLISLPPGTGLRASLDEACAATGRQPRIAFEASDPTMLARLAVRRLGVAILPNNVAGAHAPQLRAIPIIRPRLRGRIELAWRADGPVSPAAQALISHARKSMASVPAAPQPDTSAVAQESRKA